MERPERTEREKSIAEMLSKALVEIADNNAHLLTVLDLQARILAHLEGREEDELVDEVNALLKARRREAVREIEFWATGTSTPIRDDRADE